MLDGTAPTWQQSTASFAVVHAQVFTGALGGANQKLWLAAADETAAGWTVEGLATSSHGCRSLLRSEILQRLAAAASPPIMMLSSMQSRPPSMLAALGQLQARRSLLKTWQPTGCAAPASAASHLHRQQLPTLSKSTWHPRAGLAALAVQAGHAQLQQSQHMR